VDGVTLTNGYSTTGGGAISSISDGLLTISNSVLSSNVAAGSGASGGAIYAANEVLIIDSELSSNVTNGDFSDGGAIRADIVTVRGSTLEGNSTIGGGSNGGAIYASNRVDIVGSTLSGNTSSSTGGAVFAYDAEVHIINSTLSDNAASNGSGGAIYAISSDVTLINATLTNNSASQAGAIYQDGANLLTIQNSIVAGNSAADFADIYSNGLPSAQFSIIGDNSGVLLAEAQTGDLNGNFIGSAAGGGVINPLLGALADNGGSVQTHALLSGSLALNAGSDALAVDPTNGNLALAFDARGAARFSGTVDIGAFESLAPIPQDDAFTVGEHAVITGESLFDDNGNGVDSDPDANSFTVTEVNGSSLNVGTQITLASGALLTVNSDGTFDYDPNGQFDLAEGLTATDTFTYTIDDADDGYATATVTITIEGLDARDDLRAVVRGDRVFLFAGDATLRSDLDIAFNPGGVTITGLNGTTINGEASLALDDVDALQALLGNGDDTVSVSGDADFLHLDLRGGQNDVTLDGFSSLRHTNVFSRPGSLDLYTNYGGMSILRVLGGVSGDDSIVVDATTIHRQLNLNLGGGANSVEFHDASIGAAVTTSAGPSASLDFAANGSTFSMLRVVAPGLGNDQIDLDGVSVSGRTDLRLDRGHDAVNVQESQFEGNVFLMARGSGATIDIETELGDDIDTTFQSRVDLRLGDSAVLNLGADTDTVDFGNRVFVFAARPNAQLTLGNVTFDSPLVSRNVDVVV
jgi:VCBS repeat-containing protein